MKDSTKNKEEGLLHIVKGKVKDTAGNLNDKRKVKVEGNSEKISGKGRWSISEIKMVLGWE